MRTTACEPCYPSSRVYFTHSVLGGNLLDDFWIFAVADYFRSQFSRCFARTLPKCVPAAVGDDYPHSGRQYRLPRLLEILSVRLPWSFFSAADLRRKSWLGSMLVRKHSQTYATLRFLLDHPRRCFLCMPHSFSWRALSDIRVFFRPLPKHADVVSSCSGYFFERGGLDTLPTVGHRQQPYICMSFRASPGFISEVLCLRCRVFPLVCASWQVCFKRSQFAAVASRSLRWDRLRQPSKCCTLS